jgi:hypothetical protein
MYGTTHHINIHIQRVIARTLVTMSSSGKEQNKMNERNSQINCGNFFPLSPLLTWYIWRSHCLQLNLLSSIQQPTILLHNLSSITLKYFVLILRKNSTSFSGKGIHHLFIWSDHNFAIGIDNDDRTIQIQWLLCKKTGNSPLNNIQAFSGNRGECSITKLCEMWDFRFSQ